MRIQSDRSDQNNQTDQHEQSNTLYLQHVQSFNEGYSKACFDIGFSQGYNSGYQAGLNQWYWNNEIQTTDACVDPEFNFLPQTEQNKQDKQDDQCEQCEQDNSMEQVFDDNMEIDFEWYSQDNESETQYSPLYDTSTIWNVVKTDVDEDSDSRQDVDVNNIFNSHDPISWNVIKEEPKLEENSPFLFDNKYTEDPFGDYKLDSQIFSSFSWDDILSQNIDIFENTDTPFGEYKYEQLPITINSTTTQSMPFTPSTTPMFEHYSTFPIIEEDSDYEDIDENDEDTEENEEDIDESDEDTEENEEDIFENEKDYDNSWVYVTETKENKDDSTDLDSYSFNFDSFTTDDTKIQSKIKYTYTAKTCDEISLDSSISSESIAENDACIVSFSMPSLPSLQFSFDDRNDLTYSDYSNPASPLQCVYPQSPMQRVTSKK